MKEKLEKRLKELKEEFETGQKMLAEIENKEMSFNRTCCE